MTAEELIVSEAYEKIDELPHDEVKAFVVKELLNNNLWAYMVRMYQGAGLLLFGFLLIKAFLAYTQTKSTLNLEWIGWGVLFSFSLLILIHELIHYIAYRAVGTKKLSFGMKIKKFIFYVQADREVMNYKQMKIVALAPAVVIALVAVSIAMFNFGNPLYYFCFTIFSIHSLFCAGDMGMLSYFENRKEDEILTFDNKEQGVSYFYRKINKENQ